jgi:hypothetical protein
LGANTGFLQEATDELKREGKMKKLGLYVFVAIISFLPIRPVLASTCPRLVREGRDLLAKANLPADQSKKISALLDESSKLHGAGNHGDAMAKANEALAILKK